MHLHHRSADAAVIQRGQMSVCRLAAESMQQSQTIQYWQTLLCRRMLPAAAAQRVRTECIYSGGGCAVSAETMAVSAVLVDEAGLLRRQQHPDLVGVGRCHLLLHTFCVRHHSARGNGLDGVGR